MDGLLTFDISNISLTENFAGMDPHRQSERMQDQRTKEQVVDDLINFTWNADIKYTRDVRFTTPISRQRVSQKEEPNRLDDEELHISKPYTESTAIDSNTSYHTTSQEDLQYPSHDLRIPDYSLDVISEDRASLSPASRRNTQLPGEQSFGGPTNGKELFVSSPMKAEGVSTSVRVVDPPVTPKSKPVTSVPRRKFLRRRSSERKPFENVPDFIKDELNTTSGCGHFTLSELMCCLLFAHREALSSTSYANIRAKMGNKRSRVSIRRKIEKIVLGETGLSGGLLGLTGDQNQLVLEAIWSHLMKLISDAESFGNVGLQTFASQLRDYAQNPLKYALRSM